MERALLLALRGRGFVEPNPMVGCVLVRNGRVVGEGYHRRFGGSHAEVEAIRQAGESARGASAYVTLEPCSHFGKTPPCTQALIQAGVAEVVAAHQDPFPAVAGRGFQALREAGIRTSSGLLAEEAAALNAPFLTRILLDRPYIIAKWAQSLDGRIATHRGDSKWISGPKSRSLVHTLRARVDGIMVGLGTVLADDPELTARDVRVRRLATRVVLDSRLRIPMGSKLVATARDVPTIVLTTRRGVRENAAKRLRLEQRGVVVLECRTSRGMVSVDGALKLLAGHGHTNVLVEGGGALIGSLMDARLVDEVHVFTAPLILGGAEAIASCAGRGAAQVADALHGRVVRRKVIGEDQLTVLRLTPGLVGGR